MNREFHSRRMPSSFSGGFTFVEILAAMVFMAILVPAAVKGVLIANRAGVVAERSRRAAFLADTRLTEIILTDEWRDGDQEGEFSDDSQGGGEERYRWKMETKAWDNDVMREVIITVYYKVQEEEYSVRLSTIVQEEDEEE